MSSRFRPFFHLIFTLAIASAAASTRGDEFGFPWPYASGDAADADLRGVAAATPDRLFAVGDRGLSMRSVDGGRSWHRFHLPKAVELAGVGFADAKRGWICGGFLWPGSLRSQGEVWRTSDGGESWQATAHQDLPRLVGLQSFGPRELICWGDHSLARGSSLFISRDGGENFDARPSPCGHVAAAAWSDEHHGVVVDRLSRVWVCDGGEGFRQIALPCGPAEPVVSACYDGRQFWLAGDRCQLYRSADLRHWKQATVAVADDEKRLIDFRAVVTAGGAAWVATNLSGVIAKSGDGSIFALAELGNSCSLGALCRVTDEHILGVGRSAQVVESRNRGAGWWVTHQAGQRAGVLAIAATCQSLPWDILATASLGARRRAEALVVHAGDAALAADALPEPKAAVAQAASLAAASVECWDQFPIGSLSGTACRPSDLVGYLTDAGRPSEVELALAIAIRSRRPDVVVVCESAAGGEISRRMVSATLQAVRLAADPDLRLLGSATGVQMAPWKVARTIRRTPRVGTGGSLADWSVAPDALLGQSGQCVADRVRLTALLSLRPSGLFGDIVLPAARSADHLASLHWNSAGLYGDYWLLGGGRRAASHSLSIFAGLPDDAESLRPGDEGRLRNLQVLTATLRQQKAVEKLVATTAAADPERTAADLATYVETMPVEDRCRTLADAATVYLHRGDIRMWHAMLQLLLAERSENVWTELGWQQAMRFACSEELQRAARDLPLPANPMEPRTPPTSRQAGGVELRRVTETESAAVIPAAFVSPFEQSGTAAATPAAWHADVPKLEFASSADSADARHRPTNEQTKSRQSDDRPVPRGVAPWLLRVAPPKRLADRGDLTTLLLARSLTSEAWTGGAGLPKIDQAVFVPLIGWPRLIASETALSRAAAGSKGMTGSEGDGRLVHDVAKALSRPRLDGDLRDECWSSAAIVPLISAWQGELPDASEIRLLHDDQFFYVAASCPLSSRGPATQSNAADEAAAVEEGGRKRRDQDVAASDHLQLSIDLDRDYTTGFDFAVSSDGRTREACGGVGWWDPQWYVATARSEDYYRVEIAIPWEELFGQGVQPEDRCFAFRVDRQVPGVGAQNLHGLPSDRPLPQNAMLLRF